MTGDVHGDLPPDIQGRKWRRNVQEVSNIVTLDEGEMESFHGRNSS